MGQRYLPSSCSRTVAWMCDSSLKRTREFVKLSERIRRNQLCDVICVLCRIPKMSALEAEGQYGIKHEDGTLGCRHPRNWVEKTRRRVRREYIGAMGLDMGIEMDLTPDERGDALLQFVSTWLAWTIRSRTIAMARHFTRHIRNYYGDVPEGNKILDKLPKNCSSFTKVSAAPCTI